MRHLGIEATHFLNKTFSLNNFPHKVKEGNMLWNILVTQSTHKVSKTGYLSHFRILKCWIIKTGKIAENVKTAMIEYVI